MRPFSAPTNRPVSFLFQFCLLAIVAGTLLSCIRKSRSQVKSSDTLDVETLAREGETIRLALLEPDAYALSEREDDVLLADPKVMALVKRTQENLVTGRGALSTGVGSLTSISGSVFGALNLSARFGRKNETVEKGVFRHDALEVQADVNRSFIVGAGNTATLLPFGLSRGTRINIKRWFASEAEANRSSPFDFSQLPLDAKRALALKPGEYFGIPANTSLFLNVNGGFLQRAASWHKEAALLPFLQNALGGSLSVVPEGHLMGQGLFHLHILKVDDKRVRVKVTTHQSYTAGAGIAMRGRGNNRYTFFPGTRLAKLKGLQRIKEVRKPQKLIDLAHKVKTAKDEVLPLTYDALRTIAPSTIAQLEAGGVLEARFERMSEGIDRFVEAADALGKSVDELNEKTTKRFNEVIDEVNANTFDKVQQAIDKTIDADASVTLSGKFAKGLRLVADYVVDVSTPEGAMAFDRMVSGRVVMQARDRVISPWNLQKASLSDFTYADELAEVDAEKIEKRAERLAQVADTFARGDVDLTFGILKWSRGFSESWTENDVVIGGDGPDAKFKLKTWDFETTLSMRGLESEKKGSGLLLPTGAENKATGLGNYFYTWHRRYPAGTDTPVKDSLIHTINVLGPTAFLLGLPFRYTSEGRRRPEGGTAGDTQMTLSIVYLPGALARFFDPSNTEDDMWRAFGSTLRGWHMGVDRPLLKPAPRAESRIESAVGKAECASLLKTEWGQGYCDFFREEFLTRWRQAASGTRQSQADFLEHWYRRGWLANKMGGDILSRFVNELLFLKAGGDESWLKDIVVRLDYQNSAEDSEFATPDFAFGHDPAAEVVETLKDSLQ